MLNFRIGPVSSIGRLIVATLLAATVSDSQRLSGPTLRPPYRAIGHSYTYRIYVFQAIAGYRAIPPLGLGIAKIC